MIAADASPVREDFASSLAVAAMDGTVQRRFVTGTVAGQALLKTGTLEGVRALAGYVIDNEGRRFAVVAIVNHASAVRAQRRARLPGAVGLPERRRRAAGALTPRPAPGADGPITSPESACCP